MNPIALAAAAEALTGVVLLLSPSLVVSLLLGADLSEPGQALGRFTGAALLALALACWPATAGNQAGAPLPALLLFSLFTTLYLVYLGLGSELVGLLLWPAAALHAVLTVLLARMWLDTRQSRESKP
jgi:hypothetical protein